MKFLCTSPVTAWYCGFIISKDGVYSPNLVFSEREARQYFAKTFGSDIYVKMMERNSTTIDCGKCLACRIKKRKDMTTRLNNELSMYGDDCCFITLTYNDENIPTTCIRSIKDKDKMVERGIGSLPVETLLPSDVQKFIKRLRRHLEYIPKRCKLKRDHVVKPIRYFAVGEYGGKTGRPHYHLIIFGWKPSDLDFHSLRNGNVVYRSKQVEKLWTFGFSTVQPCGLGVAKYCSRYVTKKYVNNAKVNEPFQESFFPEFTLQSIKHGGIGAPWFDIHFAEIISRGYVSYRQGTSFVKAAIPNYYLRRLRKIHLCAWLQLRDEKIEFLRRNKREKTVREVMENLQALEKYCKDEKRLIQSSLL